MKTENGLKKGEKVARRAIWLEGFLVISKFFAAFLSGSLVLKADAIHSASDILSIVTSWLGLKIAQKKPSKKFHYGFYKAENIGSLIISFLIFFAFWKMIIDGYSRLFSFSSIKFAIVGLAVSLADALILYFFGKYEIKVGKEINAESLIAMGKENRTHLFSSMTVFVGILATYKQIPYVEGVTTIIISLFIFQIGLETLKKSIFALMDVAPDEEIEKKVIKIIESSAEIEEFFDLRLRKSGPFIFGEVKVGVRRFIDIKKSYEISSKIEKKIKKQMPEIKSFNVQVEPFKSDWQHLVIPVLDNNGLNSKISDKFSRAPYFLFINTEKKKVKGFYILKNSYLKNEKKVGLSVAKMITKQKSDILITKQIGKIALYALKENLMDIHMTKSNTVKEAIEDSLQGLSL